MSRTSAVEISIQAVSAGTTAGAGAASWMASSSGKVVTSVLLKGLTVRGQES
jgi:hypothetical protein